MRAFRHLFSVKPETVHGSPLLAVIPAFLAASFALWCLACQSPPPNGGDTPLRVLSLAPSITDVILEVGAGDLLVGRTDFDHDPRTFDLPSVGELVDPSIELIASLEPDLVITIWSRESPAVEKQMAALGIEVRSFLLDTMDDLRSGIDSVGVWLDVRQRAAQLRTEIDSQLAAVALDVQNEPVRSVLYAVWPNPPMIAGSKTFIDEIITTAGGVNAFADGPDGWPSVSMEAILARQPDVVIWPVREGEEFEVNRLLGIHGWQGLAAVREGRVVTVDASLFHRLGPRIAEAAAVLARAIHEGDQQQ